jgi:hypothetical protein
MLRASQSRPRKTLFDPLEAGKSIHIALGRRAEFGGGLQDSRCDRGSCRDRASGISGLDFFLWRHQVMVTILKQSLWRERSSDQPEDAVSGLMISPMRFRTSALRLCQGQLSRCNRHFSHLHQLCLRHYATEPSNPKLRQHENEKTRREGEGLVRKIVTMPAYSRRTGAPVTLSKDKYVLSKGQRLFMKPQQLGVNMLGKPAETIVMKDIGKIRRMERPILELQEQSHASIDVLEDLGNERGAPSASEVYGNIEELRPEDSLVSKEEFVRIQDLLIRGFTVAQMEGYISWNSAPLEQSTPPQPSWVLESKPWTPVVDESVDNADESLRGYVTKSSPRKHRLAAHLMRECWELSTREMLSGPGVLLVKFRDLEFSLLARGSLSWLGSVSQTILRDNGRIELVPAQHVVRITASKMLSQAMLSELNERLRTTKTGSFALSEITNASPTTAALREAGRLTNSVVRFNAPNTNGQVDIQVSWIPQGEQNDLLETTLDKVYRLLLTSHPHQEGSTNLIMPDTTPRMLVKDSTILEQLPWAIRSKHWARHVVAKSAEPKYKDEDVITPDVLMWDIEKKPSSNLASPDGWSTEPEIITTAIFGHVLHGLPPDTAVLVAESSLKSGTLNGLDRVISPVFPPLAGISPDLTMLDSEVDRIAVEEEPSSKPLNLEDPSAVHHIDSQTNTTLLLRFRPHPTDTRASSAPLLELKLIPGPVVSEDASEPPLRPVSLRAIASTHTTDILRPASRVDARLTQTQRFVLHASRLGDLAPLTEFLAAARLTPEEGNIETPAVLRNVPIPIRLFSSSHEEEPAAVTYVFAGLELRRPTVRCEFCGWRLAFSHVEAGAGGGRRMEVTLDANRIPVPTSLIGDEVISGSKDQQVGKDRLPTTYLEAVAAVLKGAWAIRWDDSKPETV